MRRVGGGQRDAHEVVDLRARRHGTVRVRTRRVCSPTVPPGEVDMRATAGRVGMVHGGVCGLVCGPWTVHHMQRLRELRAIGFGIPLLGSLLRTTSRVRRCPHPPRRSAASRVARGAPAGRWRANPNTTVRHAPPPPASPPASSSLSRGGVRTARRFTLAAAVGRAPWASSSNSATSGSSRGSVFRRPSHCVIALCRTPCVLHARARSGISHQQVHARNIASQLPIVDAVSGLRAPPLRGVNQMIPLSDAQMRANSFIDCLAEDYPDVPEPPETAQNWCATSRTPLCIKHELGFGFQQRFESSRASL